MLFNVQVMAALEFEPLLAVWSAAPFHLYVIVFRMALITWNDCFLIECTQTEDRLLRGVYSQGGVITVQGTERRRLLVLSTIVLNADGILWGWGWGAFWVLVRKPKGEVTTTWKTLVCIEGWYWNGSSRSRMEIADGIYLAEDRDKCGDMRAVEGLRVA